MLPDSQMLLLRRPAGSVAAAGADVSARMGDTLGGVPQSHVPSSKVGPTPRTVMKEPGLFAIFAVAPAFYPLVN